MRKARKSSGKAVTDLNQLFLGFLGLEEPWFIQSIEWDPLEGRVDLHVSFREGTRFPCPKCGGSHPVHDCLERTWRHLNLFQHKTYLHGFLIIPYGHPQNRPFEGWRDTGLVLA